MTRRRLIPGLLLVPLLLLAAVLTARTLALGTRPTPVLPSGDRIPVDVDRAARHLGEAIRFQTVTWQEPSPADTVPRAALQDWLVRSYPRFHAVAERVIVGGGTLIYRWPGSNPRSRPIILMAHQDVVPVQDAAAWSMPPFAGAERGGAVWGRGAIDDKGSLIALFEALESLAEHGFQPRGDIYLVSGHDEEGESRGAQAAADWLRARHVRAEFVLDEGSAIIRDHPITGGPVAMIGIAEKGYATIRITAKGSGGHSSAPPDQPAILALARALDAIGRDQFPLRYTGPVAMMLDELAPEMPLPQRILVANSWLFSPLLKAHIAATPVGAALLRTTTAPTMLAASPKENVLPVSASAWINYRIAPWDDPAAVIAHARQSVRGLPVTIAFTRTPQPASPLASTTSPAYRAIAGWAHRLTGAPTAPTLVIGGTDSRVMAPVADDIYRFEPITLSLDDARMIHGRDEHISRAQLALMVEFYAQLIRSTRG